MAQAQLSLTAKREGSTLRLSVAGELDRGGAARVERALDEALGLAGDQIVVDLSAVTFLDRAAIRALFDAHARTRNHGLDLTVVRPSGTASRVFTLTRVGEVLPVIARDPGEAHPPS